MIGSDRAGNTDTTAGRTIVLDQSVNQVALSSPADTISTNDQTPTLSWTAIGDSVGIDSYVVEVSNASNFSTISFADTVDGAVLNRTTSSLPADTYFWRVRAIDNLQNTGANSAVRSFVLDTGVTVTLTSPADGLQTATASTTFSWSSTDGETYTWQISKSSSFATSADSVVDTTVTNVTRRVAEAEQS